MSLLFALPSGPRLAVAASILVVAVVGGSLSQPTAVQPVGGSDLASTERFAIAETAALDSTFTERRTPPLSDLLSLAVMIAVVSWALPRRSEDVVDTVPGRAWFERALLVRDRGPPCWAST